MTRWTVGLAALAFLTAGIAIGLCGRAAAIFHEVDVWFRTTDGTTSDAVNDYYTRLQVTGYTMASVSMPLLFGTVLAVLILFAVLAVRWERRQAGAVR